MHWKVIIYIYIYFLYIIFKILYILILSFTTAVAQQRMIVCFSKKKNYGLLIMAALYLGGYIALIDKF